MTTLDPVRIKGALKRAIRKQAKQMADREIEIAVDNFSAQLYQALTDDIDGIIAL